MIIPLLSQKLLNKEGINPLQGTFELADSIPFTSENWARKIWQENQENILKQNLHIKPSFIRLQHEIDYQLFSEYHMGDLLEGKNGYFFSWGWSAMRCCENKFNTDSLAIYIKKLKIFSTLLNQKGKYFKVIIPPSKEEIFSEFLPDEYAKENQKNDYHLYVNELEKNKVDYWDLLDYYKSIIDTSKFPIYSRTSVHWTRYGASFTLFNLLDDMNKFFNNSMSTIYVESSEVDQFKNGDGDTETTLNLLSRIDDGNFLYYNYNVHFKENAFKPKVLTIADSYYWALKSCWRLPDIYANDSKYLYYYSTAYYPGNEPPISVNKLNIVEEFKTCDAVIILNSSHNLSNYPFGLQYDIDKIIDGLNELPDK